MLVLAMVAVLAVYSQTVKAAPSGLAIQTSASASTSPAYLTQGSATATTTYQLDSNGQFSSSKVPNMQGVDSVSVLVDLVASSTSSVLVVTPQWSNNNIDWYGFASPISANTSLNGLSFLASTTLAYYFSPTTSGTNLITFQMPVLFAQHERVQYSLWGANGSVYSEYDLKATPETP